MEELGRDDGFPISYKLENCHERLIIPNVCCYKCSQIQTEPATQRMKFRVRVEVLFAGHGSVLERRQRSASFHGYDTDMGPMRTDNDRRLALRIQSMEETDVEGF